MLLNSSQYSEVAKAAATEAVRRKKPFSECSSLKSCSSECSYSSNNQSVPINNCDSSSVHHDQLNSQQQRQLNSNNPFHQHYFHEDMQNSNESSIYASRNQSVYQSISSSNQTHHHSSSGYSSSNPQHQPSQQSTVLALLNGRPILVRKQTTSNSETNKNNCTKHSYGTAETVSSDSHNQHHHSHPTTPTHRQTIKQNFSFPNASSDSIIIHTALSRHRSYHSESSSPSNRYHLDDESNKTNNGEPIYAEGRSHIHLPLKPSFNATDDFHAVTLTSTGNYGKNKYASNQEIINKQRQIISSSRSSEIVYDSFNLKNNESNAGSRSTTVSEECQHIYTNFGDLSTPDDNNFACSDGSIKPTNPDRISSPTNESSKFTSITSRTNCQPVQFSALKSSNTYHENPKVESLYLSTDTLSRSNKPAPLPPVRKTSSISDPNAITLGTLRNAGVSTYEEIKTLKRNVRKHSGSSGYSTYDELNSGRNAIYNAARKGCLSTSLTSLVEPVYSTLDSNTIGVSNQLNSKIINMNKSSVNLNCPEGTSASISSHEYSHAGRCSSPPKQTSHSQALSKHRSSEDSLPSPPPEAYSGSEIIDNHSSHNKIVSSCKEFLRALNAKLSVLQSQRVSSKITKRRSMSLPHSDQEWDSDSGIFSQSFSSDNSSFQGSISNHSELIASSLVKRLNGNECGNINSRVSASEASSKRRNSSNSSNDNQSNSSNNSHSSTMYSALSLSRCESSELGSRNVDNYDFRRGNVDNSNDSFSKIMLKSSQHSEVAKAAANEAIRRKKSFSECSSLDFHQRNNSCISNNNTPVDNCEPIYSTNKLNTTSRNVNNIDNSNVHDHHHHSKSQQLHSNNPFHQHYLQNMQTSDESEYVSRNQSVYQSTSTPNPQHQSSQQSTVLALLNGRQILVRKHPSPKREKNTNNSTYETNETVATHHPAIKMNSSLPTERSYEIKMHNPSSRHGLSETNSPSHHCPIADDNNGEPIYAEGRSHIHLPPKPSFNATDDFHAVTLTSTGNYGKNKYASNQEIIKKQRQIISSSRSSEIVYDSFNLKNNESNAGSRSTTVSEECQHIYTNFGDLSTPDDNNFACSDGSITPTNPDRISSPTNESSKFTSITSRTNCQPVQFSALKSSNTYHENPKVESLYLSTDTLSRSNKPAPLPPVRKTSSISDPNAITLGTLRNAGVSTYEEIKTLKRNVRKHSGSSGYSTYDELNSGRNAIYNAARKGCLSTSLTSLVEPVYSTLDSNTIGVSNQLNSKIINMNKSSVNLNCPEGTSASFSSHEYSHAGRCSSPPKQTSHSQALLKHRSSEDSLPSPPPEAYSGSEIIDNHSSHNKVICMRKEFLQTLNAKLEEQWKRSREVQRS